MAFYIEPPKGDISVNQLENWALIRLRLLLDLTRCHGDMEAVRDLMEKPSSAARSDCLIEGTAKDAVSHFMLRLACSNDPVCAKMFVESETTLFMYRFMSLNELELMRYLYSLRRFQQQLKKHLELVNDSVTKVENASVQFSSFTEDIYLFFKMLTENFKWKDLIHFYYARSQKHFVKLPFKFALEMVAKRDVTLHRGNALVPCTYVAQLLGWFFQNWLNYGIKLAKYQHNRVVQDSRMKRIFTICRQTICKRYQDFDVGHGQILGSIAASDVDVLEKYFPPCMRHLLQSLRRNHRLKHYSRVTFLLFLKDLGLPVNEAIVFWKNEYSRPIPVDDSYRGCRHSWQKEKNRFLYSIQHLYGIRGSRQKYSSHLCKYIQNHNWGPAEEAFCLFKQLDSSKFNQFLKSESLSTENSAEIQEMVADQKFSLACTTFLKAKVQGEMRATSAVNNANVRIKECFCDEESSKLLSNFETKALLQTSFASSKLNFKAEFSDSATAESHNIFSFEMDISKKRMLHLAHLPPKKFIKAESSSNFSVKYLNSDADQQYSKADTYEKPCFPECEIGGFNLLSLPLNHSALAKDCQVDSGPEGTPDIYLPSIAAETDVSIVSKSVNQISSKNEVTAELDKDNKFGSGFVSSSRKHYRIVQGGGKVQSFTNDLNTAVSLPTVCYNKLSASDSIKPIDLNSKVISGKCCSCNKIKYVNVKGDSSSVVNLCGLSEMNGSGSKEDGKFQKFCKSKLNYRAKEVIRKPIDFFHTYNILVKEFQSASNIFQN